MPAYVVSNRTFSGTFDGQNHIISGIYSQAGDICASVFGDLSSATIKNFTLKDCKFTGDGNEVSAVFRTAKNSEIDNIHIDGGSITNSFSVAAGFGKDISESTIKNCSNTAPITGGAWVGNAGIVNTIGGNSKVINCFNTGDIISTAKNDEHNNYGIMWTGNGSVINCYNTGKAEHGITAGATAVINCYCDQDKSKDWFGAQSDGFVDCKAYSATEMKSDDLLTLLNSYADRSEELKNWEFKSGFDYPVIKKGQESQKLTVKPSSKTISASALQGKGYAFKISASSKTDRSYRVLKGSKYISVSQKGRVKIKKNTPKGTYSIKITAEESAKHKKAAKTVKIVVR